MKMPSENGFRYFLLMMLVVLNMWSWDAAGQLAVKLGRWNLLVEKGGVSAMHMITTYKNTVAMFDRTNFGPSQLLLDNGRCRDNPQDQFLTHDCWAHSIEYNIATNTIRPLMIFTDTWCSSGAFAANGTLVQTGGWRDGATDIRYFVPCSDASCDWDNSEPVKLLANRWYAANQILPDNRIIVVGGTGVFNYEFVPRQPGEGTYNLPFLTQTRTSSTVENNLYPFLHLSSDGNLFIFANRDSILLDYKNNVVLKTFPRMPGDGPRNYPSTGSSVMLPLSASNGFSKVEILICGGCPDNGYAAAKAGNFTAALSSCGRMIITDANPSWSMEDMPGPRTMSDMLILPNGEILIINGAAKGVAGWDMANTPVFTPYLYRHSLPVGQQRFYVLAATGIARMYHSTANVLPDGRVMAGGSNPHFNYVLTGTQFPTELRLEAYSPYYLESVYAVLRPQIITMSATSNVAYGTTFTVTFSVAFGMTISNVVNFNVYAPPFTTHTTSMGQRMLSLSASKPVAAPNSTTVFSATVTAPPTAVAAPPGYYMFFVVNGKIPSKGQWVHFS
ncbi:aldehyde oxidase GLOX-like [Cryptomeria japonica]|uniref:aldehyde oxidase GLOX-like n=1 Tax=Cryptomeria japonica TaxID=3369 RepID=UPI0027DA9C32|nr:aldehyde oxidase GLOX-like [Cryptomeria japonica]